jgi:hypothetical protein
MRDNKLKTRTLHTLIATKRSLDSLSRRCMLGPKIREVVLPPGPLARHEQNRPRSAFPC